MNTDSIVPWCVSILNEFGVKVEDADASIWLESEQGICGCQICKFAMHESSVKPQEDEWDVEDEGQKRQMS